MCDILSSGDIMELIFVRHAEPDYAKDSLTDKGRKEALLLSDMLIKENADFFYSSPLGRAKETGMYTMKRLRKDFTVLPWLTEFEGKVKDGVKTTRCWDRLPSQWTKDEAHYGENWHSTSLMGRINVREENEKVCKGIDELLEKHGYRHEGKIFKVTNSNHDKIVFFCHFAVECVILAHLFGTSPMVFWHNFVALPSSVTRVVTEEREKGIASFRTICFGDVSHLYYGHEKPSFAARYCECFEDNTKH